MAHLTVHLVNEVSLCGLVYLRWMYPFERYMKILKSYVRNHKHPTGCIAESYIEEEALEFCAEYMLNMSIVRVPPDMCKSFQKISHYVVRMWCKFLQIC